MAVNAGTVNVNNDQTGWSNADVMTALETVFSNLGMHGGTATVSYTHLRAHET